MTSSETVAIGWPEKPNPSILRCLFEGLSTIHYRLGDPASETGEGADRHVIVVSSLARRPAPETLRLIKTLTRPVILLLSDEKLRHRAFLYGRKATVVRNYYRPGWSLQRTFAIPLLPLDIAFVTARRETDQRGETFDWVFVGQKKNHRTKMVEIFESPRALLQLTAHFNDVSGGMKPEALAELYTQSTFVLCPHGNINPDTFRIMEALYCGAIPVVLTFKGIDYYRFIFGPHPFVLAQSWEEAREVCQKLLDSPEDLAEKKARVDEWFDAYRKNLIRDVETIIAGSKPRDLLSGQFAVQQSQRWNLRLIWVFWTVFVGAPFLTRLRRGVDNLRLGRRRTGNR